MPVHSGGFTPEEIPDAAFVRLLYSRPAACIVAHLEVSAEDGSRTKRLVARPVEGGKYAPIFPIIDGISQESAVVSTEAPFLFANEFRRSGPGLDWFRLQAINLVSGEQTTLLTPDTIPLRPEDLRSWISNLVEANRNGTHLVCVRAREEPRNAGSTQVIYELVELEIAGRAVTVVSELKNTLF